MSTRTEEEQILLIKSFFQHYGVKIIVALLVLLAAYVTYQYWQGSRVAAKETASIYYNELLILASEEKLSENDRAKFDEAFARLAKEYPSTSYAAYAALQKAKLDVNANDLAAARQSLEWVRVNSKNTDIKALATLRLARVALSQGDHDQALQLLSGNAGAFAALYEQAKGDVYLDQQKNDQALLAYRKARGLLDGVGSATAQLLDIKIRSLDAGDQSKVFPKVAP